ncbi:hypothetical protein FACS189449_01410 [Alphaproteobacteria bacterium]|nr:hypothetical protein FACS189449_01410 [Alphaproteobacteria bacterium]
MANIFSSECEATAVPHALSVVIPAYNAEKTIRRCLESINAALSQTAHEIIVVDDASSDNTASIVTELTKVFNNLRLIRQKKNEGPGPARNRGLAEATGEYVWFVDADDAAMVDNFRNFDLLQACDGRDVVMFRYNQVVPGVDGLQPWVDYDERVMAARPSDTFTVEEFPSVLTTTNATWNKFFRRENIISAGMDFPSTMVGEDLAFVTANLCTAWSIGFIDRELYTYHYEDSYISRLTDKRRLQTLSAMEICEKWLQYRQVTPEVMTSYYVCKAHHLLLSYKSTTKHAQETLKDYLEMYLQSFDAETFHNLLRHPFFRDDMKQCLWELHDRKNRALKVHGGRTFASENPALQIQSTCTEASGNITSVRAARAANRTFRGCGAGVTLAALLAISTFFPTQVFADYPYYVIGGGGGGGGGSSCSNSNCGAGGANGGSGGVTACSIDVNGTVKYDQCGANKGGSAGDNYGGGSGGGGGGGHVQRNSSLWVNSNEAGRDGKDGGGCGWGGGEGSDGGNKGCDGSRGAPPGNGCGGGDGGLAYVNRTGGVGSTIPLYSTGSLHVGGGFGGDGGHVRSNGGNGGNAIMEMNDININGANDSDNLTVIGGGGGLSKHTVSGHDGNGGAGGNAILKAKNISSVRPIYTIGGNGAGASAVDSGGSAGGGSGGNGGFANLIANAINSFTDFRVIGGQGGGSFGGGNGGNATAKVNTISNSASAVNSRIYVIGGNGSHAGKESNISSVSAGGGGGGYGGSAMLEAYRIDAAPSSLHVKSGKAGRGDIGGSNSGTVINSRHEGANGGSTGEANAILKAHDINVSAIFIDGGIGGEGGIGGGGSHAGGGGRAEGNATLEATNINASTSISLTGGTGGNGGAVVLSGGAAGTGGSASGTTALKATNISAIDAAVSIKGGSGGGGGGGGSAGGGSSHAGGGGHSIGIAILEAADSINAATITLEGGTGGAGGDSIRADGGAGGDADGMTILTARNIKTTSISDGVPSILIRGGTGGNAGSTAGSSRGGGGGNAFEITTLASNIIDTHDMYICGGAGGDGGNGTNRSPGSSDAPGRAGGDGGDVKVDVRERIIADNVSVIDGLDGLDGSVGTLGSAGGSGGGGGTIDFFANEVRAKTIYLEQEHEGWKFNTNTLNVTDGDTTITMNGTEVWDASLNTGTLFKNINVANNGTLMFVDGAYCTPESGRSGFGSSGFNRIILNGTLVFGRDALLTQVGHDAATPADFSNVGQKHVISIDHNLVFDKDAHVCVHEDDARLPDVMPEDITKEAKGGGLVELISKCKAKLINFLLQPKGSSTQPEDGDGDGDDDGVSRKSTTDSSDSAEDGDPIEELSSQSKDGNDKFIEGSSPILEEVVQSLSPDSGMRNLEVGVYYKDTNTQIRMPINLCVTDPSSRGTLETSLSTPLANSEDDNKDVYIIQSDSAYPDIGSGVAAMDYTGNNTGFRGTFRVGGPTTASFSKTAHVFGGPIEIRNGGIVKFEGEFKDLSQKSDITLFGADSTLDLKLSVNENEDTSTIHRSIKSEMGNDGEYVPEGNVIIRENSRTNFEGDNSGFKGVATFEKDTISDFSENAKMFGGTVLIKGDNVICSDSDLMDRAKLTRAIWRGGEQDRANKPDIRLSGKSSVLDVDLSENREENRTFSIYGNISSENGNASEGGDGNVIIRENSKIFLKGDCSKFYGTTYVLDNATVDVKREEGRYEGKMFCGAVKFVKFEGGSLKDNPQGRATIHTGEGGISEGYEFKNGITVITTDANSDGSRKFKKLRTRKGATSTIECVNAELEDADVEGTMIINNNTRFTGKLRIMGGTLRSQKELPSGTDYSTVTTMWFQDAEFGSWLDTQDKTITDIHFNHLSSITDGMNWFLDLAPEYKFADNMLSIDRTESPNDIRASDRITLDNFDPGSKINIVGLKFVDPLRVQLQVKPLDAVDPSGLDEYKAEVLKPDNYKGVHETSFFIANAPQDEYKFEVLNYLSASDRGDVNFSLDPGIKVELANADPDLVYDVYSGRSEEGGMVHHYVILKKRSGSSGGGSSGGSESSEENLMQLFHSTDNISSFYDVVCETEDSADSWDSADHLGSIDYRKPTGKRSVWNRTFMSSTDTKIGDSSKLKAKNYGTVFGYDWDAIKCSGGFSFVPTVFAGLQRTKLDFSSAQAKSNGVIVGVKGSWIHNAFSVNVLASYEFLKTDYNEPDISIRNHVLSVGTKLMANIKLSDEISLVPTLQADASVIASDDIKFKDAKTQTTTNIRTKNICETNAAPGLNLHFENKDLSANVGVKLNHRFLEGRDSGDSQVSYAKRAKTRAEYSASVRKTTDFGELNLKVSKFSGGTEGFSIKLGASINL